jgi:hypothetical protein
VVIVRTQDAARVRVLLEGLGAEVPARRAELTGKDRKVLGS